MSFWFNLYEESDNWRELTSRSVLIKREKKKNQLAFSKEFSEEPSEEMRRYPLDPESYWERFLRFDINEIQWE